MVLPALPYWLHLLAAAAWLGPQLMMFLVIVPSLRTLDAPVRVRLLDRLTLRLGWLGAFSLLMLVITGVDNIDRYSPPSMFEFRYGYILTLKVTLAAVVIVLTSLHSAVVGPRLLRLQEAALESGDAESRQLSAARRLSIAISSLTLLLSLVILLCAALLRGAYGHQLV